MLKASNLLLLLACVAAAPPSDARELYAGTWHGTGHFYATPYSKAGDSTDTTICAFQAERTYLVCEVTVDGPYGHDHQLSAYTRSDKGYAFQRITPDGSAHTATVSVSGTTWTYDGSFQAGGKTVTIRTTNDFSADGVNRWKTVYSVDGSAPVVMSEGIERRAP